MEGIDKNIVKVVLLSMISIASFSCNQKASQETKDHQLLMDKGNLIVQTTFATLSTELTQAIEESGTEGAVKYCNLRAMELTDSIANKYDCSLKRTSLKVRNASNTPTPHEKVLLDEYVSALKDGQAIGAKLTSISEDQVLYTKPIMINSLCLKCHGSSSSDITEGTKRILSEKYPHDQAIEYQEGDLRGMWSITFHSKD